MSHRDHASYLPFVSSVSPETVTDSGSQTITITGSGLTPTTEVSVPAALGTVTNRSFVQNSSVSQSIVLTVTVAEPPGTPVARLIGLKNGGLGTATASVDHGWSPAALCTSANDNYWHAGAITGYNDGDAVTSISPVVGSGGAWARWQNSSWYRPSISSCNNKPGIEFGALWDGFYFGVGTGYDFVANAQPWSIAYCMRATSIASGSDFLWILQMNEELQGHSAAYVMDRWGKAKFGGAQEPSYSYYSKNLNLKRLMITSDGSTADIRDDGVGLSVTGRTVGSDNAHTGTRFSKHGHQFLLEWIFLIGHELTAAEQTLLDDYWTDKYGA